MSTFHPVTLRHPLLFPLFISHYPGTKADECDSYILFVEDMPLTISKSVDDIVLFLKNVSPQLLSETFQSSPSMYAMFRPVLTHRNVRFSHFITD